MAFNVGGMGDGLSLMDAELATAPTTLPGATTLPGTLLAHAANTPHKAFLIAWDEADGVSLSVSFRELADCMLAGAMWLRVGASVRRGDRVAMLAPNSVAYLALSFGAMCLGAVSLNLNWRQPPATTQTLLEGLRAKALVAAQPFTATAQELHRKIPRIKLVLIEAVCAAPPALPFACPADSDTAALTAEVEALAADAVCAVFFTGGTTGTPKAVPHTHAGLLWFAERSLSLFPAPFTKDVPNAGTACFTPYFHVMGFCANLVFNLHCGCRAFLLAKHDAVLSPSLMLAAVQDLRPSCVNTIPYIVERLVDCIQTDQPPDASAALSRLHLLTYGGAALPPHCAPILKEHGIVVACTYGQTELAGPVMFGKPGGDPNALRPLPGVGFELVRGAEDGPDEGELVLLHNGSATPGYLTLPSESRKYRSLTGDDEGAATTTERFCTGDRFKRVDIEEEPWLLYLCRADDLLVHTSGEMSNPLPTEQQLLATCAGTVDAACCVGNNMPRPLLMLELVEGADARDGAVRSALLHGLDAANSKQPAYSHVLPHHVLLVELGSLPRTVKGTVQRNKAEKLFEAELAAVKNGEQLLDGSGMSTLADPPSAGDGSGGGEDGGYDSLAIAGGQKGGKAAERPGSELDHLIGMRTIGTIWIVAAHFCTREPNVGFLDAILEHAHLGATAFMTMSGFGMMWGHGATAAPHDRSELAAVPASAVRVGQMLSASYGHLLRWYTARLHRILIATWLTMIGSMVLEVHIYGAQYGRSLPQLLRCLAFVATYDVSQEAGPAWQRCPNVPAWYIGALVPAWLFFPFAAPIVRKLADVRPHGWPLALMILLLAFISHAPVDMLVNQNDPKHNPNPANVMFYFPPANMADFYCGVAAAALAKLHAPSVTRLVARPSSSSAKPGVPQSSGLRKRAVWLVAAAATDGTMYVFCRAAASEVGSSRVELTLYHATTLPMTLFLYLSVATGGLGLSTLFLRSAPMTSLGEYALYVYLLQMPCAELFCYLVGPGHKLELQNYGVPPWRAFHANSFIFYVIVLWLTAAVYTDYVEAPLFAVVTPWVQRACTQLASLNVRLPSGGLGRGAGGESERAPLQSLEVQGYGTSRSM